MRFTASIFCLAATLAAAPAFAQAKPAQPAQPLAQGSRTAADSDQGSGFTFGFGLSKDESERTLLPVGPIAKDSVALSWKPASNWDVTLDLTSRSPNSGLPNQLFPREEVTAGVTYQVTPRFRLGGGVTVKGDSLSDSLSNPAAIAREGNEASVRIESAFSF